MSNLVGRVHFNASMDGKGMPKDAERIGRQAGKSAADGYDKTWSKGFQQTLTESGRAAYRRWRDSGGESGGIYGREFNRRMSSFLKDAERAFAGLRLDANFLDSWNRDFDDAGTAARALQDRIMALNEAGKITGAQFQAAKRDVDEWADAQWKAADATNARIDAEEEASRDYIQLMEEMDRLEESTQGGKRKRHQEKMDMLGDSISKQANLHAIERAEAAMMQELADAEEERIRQNTAARENLIRVIREHNKVIGDNATTKRIADFDRLAASIRNTGRDMDGLNFKWSDMGHNARQWTLIIAAVAAGASQIATLGSAAGAGLVALGGAATGAVVGVGGLAAVIVTLTKDIETLPAGMQSVAREFKGFLGVFGELRMAIAEPAFAQMGGSFAQLEDTLRALTPQMAELGTATGKLIDRFARGMAPGTKAFAEIQKTIENSIPTMDSLMSSTGQFGVALLRSFNRAQPLVQDFVGWIETLVERFDAFTQSRSFDQWITNAQTTFGAFGGLLDATSRALNDLVTPGAVVRTAQFMDNLSGFMPSLTTMLDILGRLDLFGVLALGLNEFGEALSPLSGPMTSLAEQLNRIALVAIPALAQSFGTLASVTAPLIQLFADFLEAIPDDVFAGLAHGVVILTTAFAIFRGAAGISGMVTSLTGLGATLTATGVISQNTATKIGGALGKAGMGGMIVAGVAMGSAALLDLQKKLQGVEDYSRNAIATGENIGSAYDKLGRSAFGLVEPLTNASGALDQLGTVGTGLDKFFGTFAASFSETGRQASALASTLGELDGPIAQLAQTNLPAAADQFAAYAEQLGATDAQVLNMINSMPEFKAVLEQASLAAGQTASDQDLLTLALQGTTSAQQMASWEASAHTAALEVMTGVATNGGTVIDGLADKIRNFGSATLTTRDAERQFQEAVDQATESLGVNGTSLDTNEASGRANQAALDDIAKSALDFAAATYEETKNVDAASGAIANGRQKLLEQLDALGITGAEAEAYADKLGMIPENIDTILALEDEEARRRADGFVTRYDGKTIRMNVVVNQSSMTMPDGTRGRLADGKIAWGAQKYVVGEAGPEAIVPLHRNLAQVDPSVRWLSAVAQGLAYPGVSSGSGGGTTFEAGSIVVQGALDPRATAIEVANEIADRI